MSLGSRFSALALRGEAFLLETVHKGRQWSVLVDGGQDSLTKTSAHPLLNAIKRVSPQLKQIDVAICTHNDADHSGGFPSFLEEWLKAGMKVSEVWLPWRWSAALPFVLTDPDLLVQRLMTGAIQAAAQIEDRLEAKEPEGLTFAEVVSRSLDPESVIRHLGEEALKSSPAGQRAEVFRWTGSVEGFQRSFEDHENRVHRPLGLSLSRSEVVRRLLEETDRSSVAITERGFTDLRLFWPYSSSSVRAASLFKSTLETAEKIRIIAETALRKNILIRWFDFAAFEKGESPAGGISGFLEPVNTVEMAEPRPGLPPLQLFFSLKLTEQNVESLVFQRIETQDEPGLFFLGDSRLAFGVDKPERNFAKPQFVPKRNAIITAAHHGSRVNDRAYEVLDDWLGVQLSSLCYFIRNGGMWKQTLGKYLNKQQRRCAQCQQCFKSDRSQDVIVDSSSGDWAWPPPAKVCGKPFVNVPSIRLG